MGLKIPHIDHCTAKWALEGLIILIVIVRNVHVVFYEKPLRKFERILSTAVAYFPWSWRLFPDQMHAWLGDKLWMQSNLLKALGIPKEKLLFSVQNHS